MAIRKTDTRVSQSKKKQSKDSRRLFQHIIIVIMAGTLLVGVSGFFMLSTVVGKVLMEDPTENIKNEEPSPVYASDGKTKIGEFGGISRENITYNQIPQTVIDAFLSIEDSRYYSHNGFDLPRFISSAITNLRSGSFAQGGSTLTMQLIDNSTMKPEEEKMKEEGKQYNKTEQIERKIQEIYLSMKLENEWTKEEIITKYLNKINFGDSALGIQKASQYYFGKDVSQLNLSESAFLAGVINAPNYYNPYYGSEYYERAIKRRDQTLSMMLYHGFITETEYNIAKNTELAFQMNDTSINAGSDKYKDYLWQLRDEVINLTGKDPATTPMTIYSAMDVDAQDEANTLSSGDGVTLPENKYYQLGFTMLNSTNGEIVAVSAGRTDVSSNTYRTRQTEPKQPGSTAKPLLDYAPAFDDMGWCTARVMSDKEPYKLDSNHSIYNADGKFNGDVTLERALAQSLNTIALQTMEAYLDENGSSDMIKYLKDMGLSDETAEAFNMQYAIGGDKLEFTPTQLAAAYAAFANGGYYIKPHMVRKVVMKDSGTTISTKAEKTQIMSEQAAFMTSDLLYKAVNGKYKGYNLMGMVDFSAYPVYGKTGTTNWSDEEAQLYGGAMKDEWTVNYTSEYTIATWTGFDAGVAGGNTNINDYLYMNVNTLINKKMLDTVTTSNVRKIAKPSGVSEYGGGYIKTEYLKDAAKINPKTEVNTNIDSDPLKELIDAAKQYNEGDYTAESYQALLNAIKEATKVLNNDDATQEEIDSALAALQNAINALVKVEVGVDMSELNNLINNAQTYIDISKYNADKVKALQDAISNGINVAANDKATQDDVNAAISAINNAIQDCINNPVNNQGSTDNPSGGTTPPVTP